MSITDSISSLGSSISDSVSGLVHEVSTRTPDLAITVAEAGRSVADTGRDVAKEAVELGRHSLEAVGLVDRPRSNRWLPALLTVGLVALVAFAVTRAVRGRRMSGTTGVGAVDQTTVSLRDTAVA